MTHTNPGYTFYMRSILFLLAFFACGSLPAQKSASVEFDIKGWGDDTVYVYKHIECEEQELEILRPVEGKVRYTICLEDTIKICFYASKSARTGSGDLRIMPDATAVTLLILPGTALYIKGELTSRGVIYSASGSGYHRAAAQEHVKQLPWKLKQDSLDVRIELALYDGAARQEMDRLYKERNIVSDKIQEMKRAYVQENPDSQLSGDYILFLGCEDRLLLEPSLSGEVRNGLFKNKIDYAIYLAKELLAMQEAERVTKVGNPSVDFELTGGDGKPIRLSDCKGKWVVLFFWASWSYPCIEQLPDMKKAYERHKDNMEIIGIACADTEPAWRDAMARYDIPWKNVINPEKNRQGGLRDIYLIRGYPTGILLDPQGVIRYIYYGEDPEFYTLLDELVK